MVIVDNEFVKITVKKEYSEVGKEADVANELFLQALIGFKQFANYLAKDSKDAFLTGTEKYLIDLVRELKSIVNK